MTRQWVSDADHSWVMACDQIGCTSTSEPFPRQPDLELFAERGWFIAASFGDVCPACLAKGVVPKAQPHRITTETAVDPEDEGESHPADPDTSRAWDIADAQEAL